MIALGALAAVSILCSEMPRIAAWPASAVASAWGCALAWRERRRPRRLLVVRRDGLPPVVGGVAVDRMEVHWRGPLAFVDWTAADGRRQRLCWWPDTLPAAKRRELRLAAPCGRATPRVASMAP